MAGGHLVGILLLADVEGERVEQIERTVAIRGHTEDRDIWMGEIMPKKKKKQKMNNSH